MLGWEFYRLWAEHIDFSEINLFPSTFQSIGSNPRFHWLQHSNGWKFQKLEFHVAATWFVLYRIQSATSRILEFFYDHNSVYQTYNSTKTLVAPPNGYMKQIKLNVWRSWVVAIFRKWLYAIPVKQSKKFRCYFCRSSRIHLDIVLKWNIIVACRDILY